MCVDMTYLAITTLTELVLPVRLIIEVEAAKALSDVFAEVHHSCMLVRKTYHPRSFQTHESYGTAEGLVF